MDLSTIQGKCDKHPKSYTSSTPGLKLKDFSLTVDYRVFLALGFKQCEGFR